MGNGVVRQQRQSVGNGNAVVAAEGGAFGEHKLIVMSDIQPLLLHVQRAVHVLFAHHIHVPLQDHRSMILHAAGAVPKEDHVVCRVLNVPQSILFGKIHQIIGYFLRIPGTVGNGADFLKIMKNRGRLQTCQSFRFHTDTPFHWNNFSPLFYHRRHQKSIAISHQKTAKTTEKSVVLHIFTHSKGIS